jgi:tripartite ATP-independent transporter DctP family solute receptor
VREKRSLKILILLVVSLFVMALVIGCGGGNQGSGSGTQGGTQGGSNYRTSGELSAGHVLDPTHPFQLGLETFARLINERTDGRFTMAIHPLGVLGGEREMVEQVQMGILDITVATAAPIGNFTEAFMAVDLPFLFENHDHVYRVLDGEVGQSMLDRMEREARIKGLAYFENGFRQMTSSVRPIVVPSDLQGVIFRTMENPIHQETFRTFGATPIPMSFAELFVGLQQGTAQGQENPLPIIYTSRLYEVQDYLAITNHFYGPAPLLINITLWESLSPSDQAIFQQAAYEARDTQRTAIVEMNRQLLEGIAATGIHVTRPDIAPWQEAAAPVYEHFINIGRVDGDLVRRIQQLAN